MGIYIKGMEMPKDKSVTLYLLSNGNVYNVYADGLVLVGKAIPVPKHGRLIDADAYLSQIKPLSPEDCDAGCTFDTVKRLMVNSINAAPTIIPAEEVSE